VEAWKGQVSDGYAEKKLPTFVVAVWGNSKGRERGGKSRGQSGKVRKEFRAKNEKSKKRCGKTPRP